MFLDKDQFLNSSDDETQKKKKENLLLDLDDGDDDDLQENNFQQGKVPEQKETKTFLKIDSQKKQNVNQYNFLDEEKSIKTQSQQEKSKKIQEQLGMLKQKRQQAHEELGVISNTQFQTNVKQNLGDSNTESQLLLASQTSFQQSQYEPGMQQTESYLPKLQGQAAHIGINEKKDETPKNFEKENEIYQVQKFQNQESFSSEERDSNYEEEIQCKQQQFADNDKEANLDEEKEQENFKPTAPNPIQQHITQDNYTLKLLTETNIKNIKEFVTRPCPKGYLIQCTVMRKKGGFGWLYPKYHLFLSNGKKYLMSAKKKSLNKTSNYVISLSQDNFNIQSDYALGKVRSNFMGTEFKIYDNGLNPKKCVQWDKVRSEIGAVIYESNMLGNKGPRRMKVFTPEVKSNGESVKFKPLKKEEGILQCFKVGKKEGISYYYNKTPKWNEQAQAFVLNFHGRVDKASVKNFQLVNERDDEEIYMQFGRIANAQFNLDLQYPMSLVQAFGIALSSFDYKLACE